MACDTSKGCAGRISSIRKETWLLLFTLSAIIIGIALGLGLRTLAEDGRPALNQRQLIYLKFPGEIFLRMLQMIILPLIISSIVSSLAQMDIKTAGRLGAWTVVYYVGTTLLAVIEGIILVSVIKPGSWSVGRNQTEIGQEINCLSMPSDTILDLFRNLLPDNLIAACTKSVKTCVTYQDKITGQRLPAERAMNMSQDDLLSYKEIITTRAMDGMNILGLIVFSMLFGVIISLLREDGAILRELFKGLESTMMTIVSLLIWYAPIGIIFLTAYQLVEMGDVTSELKALSGYVITVLVGLFLHGVVILPLIFIIITRRNPLKFVYGMMPALLTALGTSSSSATLPLTIECCEDNNGIDRRVSRFVLPLGSTINMDGTALYEAVAALYIAQVLNRVMSVGDIVLVSLTATLASVGAAGIPQAGLVTMIMVLIAVGLPSSYFILIIPVDWFLDRFRTIVNVHGDSLGSAVVQQLCSSYLVKVENQDGQEISSRNNLPLNNIVKTDCDTHM